MNHAFRITWFTIVHVVSTLLKKESLCNSLKQWSSERACVSLQYSIPVQHFTLTKQSSQLELVDFTVHTFYQRFMTGKWLFSQPRSLLRWKLLEYLFSPYFNIRFIPFQGFAQTCVQFWMVELLTQALVLTRLLWNFAVMKIFDWWADQGWNALMEGGTESYRFVRVSRRYRV